MTEKIYYMWKNEIMAIVEVDYDNGTVRLDNKVDIRENAMKLPFGIKEKPTIEDVKKLFESRCIPSDRADIQDILERMGMSKYEPRQMVKITHGVMLEDKNWIRFEGDDLDYERDIQITNKIRT